MEELGKEEKFKALGKLLKNNIQVRKPQVKALVKAHKKIEKELNHAKYRS